MALLPRNRIAIWLLALFIIQCLIMLAIAHPYELGDSRRPAGIDANYVVRQPARRGIKHNSDGDDGDLHMEDPDSDPDDDASVTQYSSDDDLADLDFSRHMDLVDVDEDSDDVRRDFAKTLEDVEQRPDLRDEDKPIVDILFSFEVDEDEEKAHIRIHAFEGPPPDPGQDFDRQEFDRRFNPAIRLGSFREKIDFWADQRFSINPEDLWLDLTSSSDRVIFQGEQRIRVKLEGTMNVMSGADEMLDLVEYSYVYYMARLWDQLNEEEWKDLDVHELDGHRSQGRRSEQGPRLATGRSASIDANHVDRQSVHRETKRSSDMDAHDPMIDTHDPMDDTNDPMDDTNDPTNDTDDPREDRYDIADDSSGTLRHANSDYESDLDEDAMQQADDQSYENFNHGGPENFNDRLDKVDIFYSTQVNEEEEAFRIHIHAFEDLPDDYAKDNEDVPADQLVELEVRMKHEAERLGFAMDDETWSSVVFSSGWATLNEENKIRLKIEGTMYEETTLLDSVKSAYEHYETRQWQVFSKEVNEQELLDDPDIGG